MTPASDDRITRLRDRIKDTQDAAARLAEEATAAREEEQAAAGGAGTWSGAGADHERRVTDAQALVALLESLRDLIPDELREQFRELLRQVLLLVRALIDWWVERMEPPPASAAGPAVQDIPVF